MRMMNLSFIRRLLGDESGQTMYLMAFGGMALVVGLGGLTIDAGHAYVVRSQVQGSVNAAALAGVRGLTDGSAVSLAQSYETLNNNPHWGTITSPTPTMTCLNMMMPVGQSCATSSILNAVKVTESVVIPTYFMKIFGTNSLTVRASATASPAHAKPVIVEVVLDTTPSMADSDSNCTGASTAEQCALMGIQGFLQKANPCPPGSSGCTAAQSNIRVGLMTFPNIATTDAPDNYNCSGTVAFQSYSSPVIPASTSTTSYTPITYTQTTGSGKNKKTATSTLTYQSTYGATDMDANGFYTNFYSATSATNLNPSSTLVKAIGGGTSGAKPCLQQPSGSTGITSGGETSFAGAIYAAQTALQAEQAVYPTVNGIPTRTVIVFLSDGQANTLSSAFPNSSNTTVSSNGLVALNSNGTYPSGIDACQQAITATQYAKGLGTTVYTVAYGSEVGGCLSSQSGSDQSPIILTGTLNVPISSISQVTPCNTVMDMASTLWTFYSDANQELSNGGSGVNSVNRNCTSADHPSITSLDDIFLSIYEGMAPARLVPNDAT